MNSLKKLLPFLLLLLSSCGKNELECQLKGDNASGRITFNQDIAINSSANLRIEWSEDSFASIAGHERLTNAHGIPTFGYSACVDNDKNYSFRVFQDSNLNNQFDPGEASGRHDGTSDGNADYIARNIPTGRTAAEWHRVGDIHITVDVP